MYALGYNTREMIKLFNEFAKVLIETNPGYFITHVARKRSLLPEGMRSGENIEVAIKDIANYKKIRNIKQLKIPIAIPAVDLINKRKYVFTNNNKEEKYYIKDIEIGKAVRASCSFPGIYAPYNYSGHSFADGGILDNIPVIETKKIGADKVIAVQFNEDKFSRNNNMYTIVLRSIDIMTHKMSEQNLNQSDFIVNLNLGEIGLLDISKINYCYKIGYETTKQLIITNNSHNRHKNEI